MSEINNHSWLLWQAEAALGFLLRLPTEPARHCLPALLSMLGHPNFEITHPILRVTFEFTYEQESPG